MTRPEDIPEDVWETAERASEWWKPHAAEDYHALRIDFARAILAERAAAEQRGREEAADVARTEINRSAAVLRPAELALIVADAIRRGDGTAPPSSPPEQNGESATPSHAPEGRG